ncbi:MAG: DNA-3-methyladenine glycosylase I [Gemmatimonadota bacterium]|nr:DNA-3-methyladenine glycosylase I [Gemmatimonadota bacterium]
MLAAYHDDEYGFPLSRDDDFFERLVLEINQAGLSWLTVLKKRKALREAFEGFDVDRVAAYGDEDRARLLGDAGIIRNRLKIDAAIQNARVIREIRAEHGSFAAWLNGQTCTTLDEWVAVFRKTFRFMGPEIVGEFLMSTGYLPIHHDPECFLAGQGHRVG